MPDGNGSRTLWPIAIASEVSNSTAAPHISGDTFFHTSTTITITAVSGADIYYTTDGTTPAAEETEATHRYSSTFEITGTTIVKAIAVVSGQEPSAVATMRFIEAVTTGIEAIAAPDAEDSTQDEYFTLQGIRITDPANGLYIKRCGAHYTKVLIH
jgi:hypothetical protein